MRKRNHLAAANPAISSTMQFVPKIRNFFNDTRVRRAITLSSEVLNALQPLIEKRSLWNLGKTALTLGSTLLHASDFTTYDYFNANENWVYFGDTLGDLCLHIVTKKVKPTNVLQTTGENTLVCEGTLDNVRFGWSVKIGRASCRERVSLHV
jgi:hypothetical protein